VTCLSRAANRRAGKNLKKASSEMYYFFSVTGLWVL
jgi:hypothetical protein